MVYLKREKKVRTEQGKLRLNEAFRNKRITTQEIFFTTCLFQTSLSGIFFENLESARHNRRLTGMVSGILIKEITIKEDKGA